MVALKVALYDGGESPFTSADTLSVEALGTDSVLINRLTNFKDFTLPLKMTGGFEVTDTFLLHWVAKGHAESADAMTTDTLCVSHTGRIHSDGMDCPPVLFHTLTKAEYRGRHIANLTMGNPEVDYEHHENIRLSVHPLAH